MIYEIILRVGIKNLTQIVRMPIIIVRFLKIFCTFAV